MKRGIQKAGLGAMLALGGMTVCGLVARQAGALDNARGVTAGGRPAARREITFARDIAPLLNANCASCHRPGEVAPFTLASYRDAQKRARQIALVTQSRQMPPWKVASHGEFQDERRLTDAQIALIQQWVAEGRERRQSRRPAARSALPCRLGIGQARHDRAAARRLQSGRGRPRCVPLLCGSHQLRYRPLCIGD